MPGKGKHRRPKSRSLARGFAAAGAGGAALAMPFIGATGAHAAEHAAPTAAPVKAASAKAASVKAAPAKAATTYSVVPGDYLSKIAAREQVSGGWHKLYDDNRSVIGSDPSLIRPGMKLTVGAKAAAAPAAPSASAKTTATTATTTATPAAATKQTDGGYTLPVDGAPIGTPYHQNGAMWSSGYHTGTDFVVPTGTTVKAVAAGTVVTAGWGGSYGNQVVIRHSDGDYSQYGHMSALTVSAGQTVTEGQQIGVSGATGNVTGPHLHFEIRTGPDYGSDIDPLAYLREHGVTV